MQETTQLEEKKLFESHLSISILQNSLSGLDSSLLSLFFFFILKIKINIEKEKNSVEFWKTTLNNYLKKNDLASLKVEEVYSAFNFGNKKLFSLF